MRSRGFIFSLDAFVAFLLITITISFLIFTIGTPKPFYSSLEQAHQLAYDTLNVLATSTDQTGNPTYLEQIMSDNVGSAQIRDIMVHVVGGNDSQYRPIIPLGFGYTFRTYNYVNNTWTTIFESNSSSNCPYTGRCGKQYTKLQTSASTFTSIYVNPQLPGDSPYCYLNCHGYDIVPTPHYSPSGSCTKTPCDAPTSNFISGDNSIQIIELIVYT